MSLAGFDELRKMLRELPEALANDAAGIVSQTASEMATEQRLAYPEGPTGNLRNGVKLSQEGGRVGVRAIVKSAARHALIFEKGTNQRQTRTGANRGRMPPATDDVQMIPRAIRARKRMYDRLTAVVESHGLEVSGSA